MIRKEKTHSASLLSLVQERDQDYHPSPLSPILTLIDLGSLVMIFVLAPIVRPTPLANQQPKSKKKVLALASRRSFRWRILDLMGLGSKGYETAFQL